MQAPPVTNPVVRPYRAWLLSFYMLLWCAVALLWAFPHRSQLIDLSIVAAFAIACLRLPSQYAAAAAASVFLLLSLHDGFGDRYFAYWRWILLFCGTAIFFFRYGQSRYRWSRPTPSLFRAAMAAYVIAATASSVSSVATLPSLAKSVSLAAIVVSSLFLANALTRDHGAMAAKRLSSVWASLLAPSVFFTAVAQVAGFTPTLGSVFKLGAFRGASGNANAFASAIAFFLPHVLGRLAVARPSETRKAAGWLGLSGLLAYWILISRSRASGLAAAVAAGVMLIVHPRGNLARAALAGGFVLALVLATTPPARLQSASAEWLYKGSREVMTSRVALWGQSRDRFLEHPVLGLGFGVTTAYESLTAGHIEIRTARIEQGSSFWALLSQTGLCGFLPVVLGLLDVLFRALRFALAVRDPYFTAITASVVGLTIHSFFEGWAVSPGSGLLWVMLLQCFVLDAITSRFRPPAPTPRLRATASRGRQRPIAATPEPTLY